MGIQKRQQDFDEATGVSVVSLDSLRRRKCLQKRKGSDVCEAYAGNGLTGGAKLSLFFFLVDSLSLNINTLLCGAVVSPFLFRTLELLKTSLDLVNAYHTAPHVEPRSTSNI